MLTIRLAEPRDAAEWAVMRHALWPDGPLEEHRAEIAGYFAGAAPEPLAVLVAAAPEGRLIGFAELGERPFAEGCATRPVAYLEGWYVADAERRRGVGRALVAAAEAWAQAQGYRELASDTEFTNEESAGAHRALGFHEVALIRCFRKELHRP